MIFLLLYENKKILYDILNARVDRQLPTYRRRYADLVTADKAHNDAACHVADVATCCVDYFVDIQVKRRIFMRHCIIV